MGHVANGLTNLLGDRSDNHEVATEMSITYDKDVCFSAK